MTLSLSVGFQLRLQRCTCAACMHACGCVCVRVCICVRAVVIRGSTIQQGGSLGGQWSEV